jgi:hypothetical protein
MNSFLYLICICLLYYLSFDTFPAQATEDNYMLPLLLLLQCCFPRLLDGEAVPSANAATPFRQPEKAD